MYLGESGCLDTQTEASSSVTFVSVRHVVVSLVQSIQVFRINLNGLVSDPRYCCALIIGEWHRSQVWVVHFTVVVLYYCSTNQKSIEGATFHSHNSVDWC